jgi:menaquinone-specific isochorismate synthase
MSTAACPFSPEIADLQMQLRDLDLTTSPQWVQLQVPLEHFSAVAWLASQASSFRFFWRNRNGSQSRAGWGTAWEIQTQTPSETAACLQKLSHELAAAPPEIRAYGGLAFPAEPRPNSVWKAFAPCRFVIPRFEIVNEGQPRLCLNARLEDPQDLRDLQRALSELEIPVKEPEEPHLPPLLFKQSQPDRLGWETQIQALLQAFEAEKLQKAVLAREVSYQTQAPFSGQDFLLTLLKRNWPGYLYYFQWSPETFFAGLSPERLYQRSGRSLMTEALAGTRRSSAEKIRQDQWQHELLTNPKERHEHNLVREFLESALHELCDSEIETAPVELIESGPVQHLRQPLQGHLNAHTSDGDILKCLHPTPAVGGAPRQAALTWLAEHQNVERGWYSGPVGWISAEHAEFAVALRCLLADQQTLRFFTGVGIVRGSEPKSEWNELNAKLETLLQLFHQSPERMLDWE